MILLSSPLKNDPLETTVSICFFLEIEIFTTKIVNSKSFKKICRQLLSTMNILNLIANSNCLDVINCSDHLRVIEVIKFTKAKSQ